MAALLVGMSVMAVLMGALLPMWTTLAKREKEAELVFRGNQYARAIALFQRKFANTAPPSIDLLVEQRFLRKKYKDPITNDDFQPLYANQATMPAGPGGGGPQSGQRGATGGTGAPGGQLLQQGFGATGATAAGGIIGVTSKSKETSLRIFNGRSRYNEWAFVNVQTSQQVGGPVGGPPGAPNGQRPGQNQNPQQQSPFQQRSPFGQPPGNNPSGGPGMPMQPPGMGTSRPPLPGSFGSPSNPFSPSGPQTQPPQPQRRPPGQ
jgi:type II secretory pathway pseudopilin PulG